MFFTRRSKRLPFIELWLIVLSTSTLMSCSDATTTTTNTTDTSTTFPASLSVSSPTDVVDEDATPSVASLSKKTTMMAGLKNWFFPHAIAAGPKIPRYTWATLRISSLLNGTDTAATLFKPELF
ncbi:hypothetical protein MNBD_NITROSPIRAE01-1479 [hydrothermal vent metagenome]|uniref:Uncharacterized protein n=1 Tax=hydrothermal vent metagenome TaxID=652676 RepID=A0A3B1CBS1_9ZZZZ